MTFGAIKTRIADELVRPDLAAQIALAVQDAIAEASANRFWFNEVRGVTFSTIAGQVFYSTNDLKALTQIDDVSITVVGQRRDLELVNALDVADWLDGQPTLTGEPNAYARQANGILLWMVPNAAYQVSVDGVSRFAPLVNDADDNPYLVEGERYVRALAKARVWEDVARDFDEADRQWAIAERQRQQLLSQTGNQNATNTMAAYL